MYVNLVGILSSISTEMYYFMWQLASFVDRAVY